MLVRYQRMAFGFYPESHALLLVRYFRPNVVFWVEILRKYCVG